MPSLETRLLYLETGFSIGVYPTPQSCSLSATSACPVMLLAFDIKRQQCRIAQGMLAVARSCATTTTGRWTSARLRRRPRASASAAPNSPKSSPCCCGSENFISMCRTANCPGCTRNFERRPARLRKPLRETGPAELTRKQLWERLPEDVRWNEGYFKKESSPSSPVVPDANPSATSSPPDRSHAGARIDFAGGER